MTAFLFLVIGFLLIFIEFYLPGVIIGTVGGVFVLISLILFAIQTNSLVAVVLYTLGIVVGLILLIRFAIWRIRTAKPQRSIYSDAAQNGYQAVNYDASMIGKTGVVLTDLKPGGFILVEGKQLPAISQEGYLSKGTHVRVLAGEESNLIVKKIEE